MMNQPPSSTNYLVLWLDYPKAYKLEKKILNLDLVTSQFKWLIDANLLEQILCI